MAIQERKTKTGDRRYVVRVRDPLGQWYEVKVFALKCDAERYERELKRLNDEGRNAQSKGARNLLFGEYLGRWMIECRGHVSDGWKISQNQMIRDYILPHLANRRFAEIQPYDIGNVIEKSKERLQPQTAKHIYSLLRKMFGDAGRTLRHSRA
ncbi:MAG: hypothetical protein A2583_10090 [Bdellovibrionales bacterium RIFOXYD1_FULL_53_11]|nr:MAG: hypothetical protein A2583_10090 [Bdellovibrionales bacterium RIFOXYD1_FULL_53_11]